MYFEQPSLIEEVMHAGRDERAMLVRNSHNPLLFTDLFTLRYFTAGDNMNEQYQRINSFFPIHHSCTSFREHGDDY